MNILQNPLPRGHSCAGRGHYGPPAPGVDGAILDGPSCRQARPSGLCLQTGRMVVPVTEPPPFHVDAEDRRGDFSSSPR
jgi:hypothetical protein